MFCSVKFAIMADRALLLREDLYRVTEQAKEFLHPETIYRDVIGVLVMIWLSGFVLGFVCAIKVWPIKDWLIEHQPRCHVSAGYEPDPEPKEEKPQSRTIGTNPKCPSCTRSIGTQSQTTYKRKLLTPRFHVLPEMASGVSDVSFAF